jgi:hypothetical protein
MENRQNHKYLRRRMDGFAGKSCEKHQFCAAGIRLKNVDAIVLRPLRMATHSQKNELDRFTILETRHNRIAHRSSTHRSAMKSAIQVLHEWSIQLYAAFRRSQDRHAETLLRIRVMGERPKD